MIVRGLLLCFFLISQGVFAERLQVTGTFQQRIPLNPSLQSNQARTTLENSKTITLLRIHLSDDAHQALARHVEHLFYQDKQQSIPPTKISASKQVQLGMANVPVLDQGVHGTCVTFAVTAALDAALKKGDYLSQLCILQLGNYFEHRKLGLSGWDGLWGSLALERMTEHGGISKTSQKKYGCGGMTSYPTYSLRPNSEMTPEQYHSYSENTIKDSIHWATLFNRDISSDEVDMNDMLNQVKAALTSGKRVVFGVLLPETSLGVAGATGWHHYFNDTWVLTPAILKALSSGQDIAGHEMIITGFDDNAVAMDYSGHRHHGLLKLRNSWGQSVGDWGEFYMTYDYFKALADDAQSIEIELP